MVTVDGNILMEIKNFSIDKDGLGRIIIPKIMTQASGLRHNQLIEITCKADGKGFLIIAKNNNTGGSGG